MLALPFGVNVKLTEAVEGAASLAKQSIAVSSSYRLTFVGSSYEVTATLLLDRDANNNTATLQKFIFLFPDSKQSTAVVLYLMNKAANGNDVFPFIKE